MINLEVIGTLGKDAEVKSVNGVEYTTFRVAVNTREKSERTVWIDAMKYGRSDRLLSVLRKGTKVYLSGNASVGAYVNKDNEAVASLTVWVSTMEITRFADDGGAGSGVERGEHPPHAYGHPLHGGASGASVGGAFGAGVQDVEQDGLPF